MRALIFLALTACSGSQGDPLQTTDSSADVGPDAAIVEDTSTPDAGPVESGTFEASIGDVSTESPQVEAAAPQDHCVTKIKSYYCTSGFDFYTEVSGGDIEPCSYISPSCPSGKPCYAPVVNGTDWGVCQ